MMPNMFSFVTWNVFHGTPARHIEPKLIRRLQAGASVFALQEAASRDVRDMLRRNDVAYVMAGNSLVAWSRARWQLVRMLPQQLSPTPWHSRAVGHDVYCEAAVALLCDMVGRSILVASYHMPSDIQGRDSDPTRQKVASESFAYLDWLMHDSEFHTDAVILLGDNNVDLDDPHPGVTLPRRLERAVSAPAAPTFARRTIDYGFIKSSRLVVDDVTTLASGADETPAHKIVTYEAKWQANK